MNFVMKFLIYLTLINMIMTFVGDVQKTDLTETNSVDNLITRAEGTQSFLSNDEQLQKVPTPESQLTQTDFGNPITAGFHFVSLVAKGIYLPFTVKTADTKFENILIDGINTISTIMYIIRLVLVYLVWKGIHP